jgi:putative flippase GtrA
MVAGFNAVFYIGLGSYMASLGIKPGYASVLALMPVLALSYLGHKHGTFRSKGRNRDELPRFLVMSVMDLLLAGWLPVLTAFFHLPHIMTFILVSVAVPLANLILMRFWIFARSIAHAPYDDE